MYIYDISVWETPCTFCSENAKSTFSIQTVSKKCVKYEQVLYLILKLKLFMFLIVCMHVNATLKGSRVALDFIIFIPFFHFFFHEKVRARPNRALIKRQIAMLMHALFLSSGTMRHNGANV